jgi:hypothetical protein
MKYQLTIDRRTNDQDRLEVHVFGTLEQAKQAAARKAGGEVAWTTWANPMTGEPTEDKLNGQSGALFFEIDPLE